MRAIIEINPAKGDGSYSGWIDFSDRIISPAKIRHQYEGSGWSYGVAVVSFASLTFENEDGMLSPADDYRSIFTNAPTGKSRIRVRYGGTSDDPRTVVFLGFVSGKTSYTQNKTNRASLVCRSIGAVLRDLNAKEHIGFEFPKSRDAFFNDLFSVPVITELVGHGNVETLFEGIGDSNIAAFAGTRFGGYTISPSVVGDGDSILQVINKVLAIEDAVFLYNYRRDTWVVTKRGELPSPSTIIVNDILDVLEQDDGGRKLINEITFSGAPDVKTFGGDVTRESETLTNDKSIRAYGRQSVSVDASFLSLFYYRNRVREGFNTRILYPQAPRKRVKLLLDADNPAIPENWWGLGEHVYVDPKPLSDEDVGVVADATPLNPELVTRSIWHPGIGRDGIGVLGKWTSRLGKFGNPATPVFAYWDIRRFNNLPDADRESNYQIRLSADGSATPQFGYFGQIRVFHPRGSATEWSARISFLSVNRADSLNEILAAGPHFDLDYLEDLRWLFKWREHTVTITIPRSVIAEPYTVTPGSHFNDFMDTVNAVPRDALGDISIALVDSKAKNIDESDPSTVLLGYVEPGGRLPYHVGGDDEPDVTHWRRTA